ncbi:hypothetical protein AAHE18_03G219300 [Arachis hypogaea]
MAVKYSRLSLLIIMMIMVMSQLSSCCKASRWMGTEIKQTKKRINFQQFTWHSYTRIQEEPSKEKVHPIYGVSLRDVPGGPNPLHN